METTITDFIDLSKRLDDLGLSLPQGIAILPANIESAESPERLIYQSETATVKSLFRQAEIPLSVVGDKGPHIQNNGYDWLAPTLFVSASVLSQNANLVGVGLNVLSDYITDFFKGLGDKKNARLDVIVETTKSKKFKRISYSGPIEGLRELHQIIHDASNE